MWESKFFKTGIGILLLFLIIYIGTEIAFIFYPIVVVFEVLFISFLISGIFYYFTYPLVDWLHEHKLPRTLAVFFVFITIIGMLTLLVMTIGPILQEEFTKLADNIPEKVREARELLETLQESAIFARFLDLETFNLDDMIENLAGFFSRGIAQIVTSVTVLVDFITGIFMTVIIVPFLLYYMLKEKGRELIPGLVNRFAPQKYSEDINSALAEMNKGLGTYVQGLGIVCLLVGILAYIGFLIIGLNYALLLSIFIMITNIIPFIGPFIGAVPAVLVAILESPLMMLKVIIVIVVVQQIESLVVSPQIMGRKLALSPLAIILIVLVAGRLGGLLGIILAIPAFTVLKIIAAHIFEHIELSRQKAADNHK